MAIIYAEHAKLTKLPADVRKTILALTQLQLSTLKAAFSRCVPNISGNTYKLTV